MKVMSRVSKAIALSTYTTMIISSIRHAVLPWLARDCVCDRMLSYAFASACMKHVCTRVRACMHVCKRGRAALGLWVGWAFLRVLERSGSTPLGLNGRLRV